MNDPIEAREIGGRTERRECNEGDMIENQKTEEEK